MVGIAIPRDGIWRDQRRYNSSASYTWTYRSAFSHAVVRVCAMSIEADCWSKMLGSRTAGYLSTDVRTYLQRRYHWSVEIFEETRNPGNAQLMVMEREMTHGGVYYNLTKVCFCLPLDIMSIAAHSPSCVGESRANHSSRKGSQTRGRRAAPTNENFRKHVLFFPESGKDEFFCSV